MGHLLPRDDLFVAFAFHGPPQNSEMATDPFNDWPMGQLLTYVHGPATGLKANGALRGLRIDSGLGTLGYWAEDMDISVENIEEKEAECIKVESSCFYYMKYSEGMDCPEGFELEKGMHRAFSVLSGLFDAMPSRLRKAWEMVPPLSHLGDLLLWLAVNKAHPLLNAFALQGWRSLEKPHFMPDALFFHLEPDLRTATDYAINTLRDVAQIYAHPKEDAHTDTTTPTQAQPAEDNKAPNKEQNWSKPYCKKVAAATIGITVPKINGRIQANPRCVKIINRQTFRFDKNDPLFTALE